MPKEITIENWRNTEKGKLEYFSPTDIFYTKLANQLYRKLSVIFHGRDGKPFTGLEMLCIKLSRYLEDIISSLGIFQAFRELNMELTKRTLPFFDVTLGQDYYDDDLNIEDIKLLVWSFCQDIYNVGSDEKWDVVDPKTALISDVAQEAMDILVDAFEKAPENVTLKKFLYPDRFTYDEFHSILDRLGWFFDTCYMTSAYYWKDNLNSKMEKISMSLSGAISKKNVRIEDNTKRLALQQIPLESTSLFLSLPNYRIYGKMLKDKGLVKLSDSFSDIKVYDSTFLYVDSATEQGVNCYDADGNKYNFELKGCISKETFDDRNNWGCLWMKWFVYNCKCYQISDLGIVPFPETQPYPIQQPKNRAQLFVGLAKELAKKEPVIFGQKREELNAVLKAKIINAIKELPADSPLWKTFVEIHFDKNFSPESLRVKDLRIDCTHFLLFEGVDISVLENKKVPKLFFISDTGKICFCSGGIRWINLPQNSLYNPKAREEFSVEFYLLRKYNYETAKYLVREGAYNLCSDHERNNKKLRRFIANNIEFLSRFIYRDQFTNFSNDKGLDLTLDFNMDYSQSFIWLLDLNFTYEIIDPKAE